VTQNIHLAVSLFYTRADDTTSRPTNYYNKYMTPVVTHEPFTCPPLKRPLMHISCHIPCHIQQSNHNASHFSNVTTVEVYRRRRQEKSADNTHSHSLTHIFPETHPPKDVLPFALLTTLILPLALTAPTHPLYPRFDPKNLTGIDIQMMTRVQFPSLHLT
jgi:hypothetical protein